MPVRKFSALPTISWFSLIKSIISGKKKAGNQIHKDKALWLKRYGEIMKYPLKPAVVDVYSAPCIGALLRADDKWPLRPVLPLMSQAITRGHLRPSISHVNGAEWAEIRQKMQKIFLTPGAAAHFYDDQVKVSEEFADALLRQQKRYGSIRDLRSWSCRYAAESVGRILIGGKLRSFSDNIDSPGSQLCRRMDRLFQLTDAGMMQPPWSNMIQTKLYNDWIMEYRESKLLVEELISKYGFQKSRSQATRHASLNEQRTFFSELLANQELSIQEAVDFAEELFIAGVESTGNALTFLVYHLAKNPDKQEKLYKELEKAVGNHDQITAESFTKLQYLRACVKESMRLSPPVTGTVRVISTDIVLGTYNIPSGTIVNTGSDVMCHFDKYFTNPLEFTPERWLGDERRDIVPFSYIPFGFGARMCIGRRFAEQELQVAIATLVRLFRIDLTDSNLELDRVSKIFSCPDKDVGIKLLERSRM